MHNFGKFKTQMHPNAPLKKSMPFGGEELEDVKCYEHVSAQFDCGMVYGSK